MSFYNPYDYWKPIVSEIVYTQIKCGIKSYISMTRNKSITFEEIIEFTLLNNSCPLLLEMINSKNPIEFITRNIDYDWNWFSVGFFTASIFETRFLAYRLSQRIKKELLIVTHSPEYYFRYINPSDFGFKLDKPKFKIVL